ncbi:phosphoadenosine phosphosulfate reductase [Tateyamaria omphalii]|uniref:Phosphoadenosine phosphosulfate reductase n=1 Tax=Tateyamaria omphalii TaxID=299262 RepID=A0A1P8MUN6_9RHOB|nr:phosphoadenosine phosphosulfate reductase [Tateyamaria omphalii]APX11713.1 phosphoadenosine phosphosulfate reductase [Tateyamaria omphalii]
MQDDAPPFEPDMADLPKAEWLTRLAQTAETHGFFKPLGRKHFAAHIQRTDTLIVTFESVQGMRALTERAEPLGWSMVRDNDWSHLCIASDGDTWFRDRQVMELFDDLTDDGFFDAYETVLFYGAGPCGYAAAAYSVAAPGAQILMIQPQATLDPRVTAWDDRFVEMRRTDFTSRYGYAPDMLDACAQAYILYDPVETLDAMHAALFTRAGVTQYRLRNMGDTIQSDLVEMNVLPDLMEMAAEGALDALQFAKIYRARRTYRGYLRRVLAALDRDERTHLSYMMARNVVSRMKKAPRFQRRLAELEARRTGAEVHDEG